MFSWGVLKCRVPKSLRFYIGNFLMYTFFIPIHPLKYATNPALLVICFFKQEKELGHRNLEKLVGAMDDEYKNGAWLSEVG